MEAPASAGASDFPGSQVRRADGSGSSTPVDRSGSESSDTSGSAAHERRFAGLPTLWSPIDEAIRARRPRQAPWHLIYRRIRHSADPGRMIHGILLRVASALLGTLLAACAAFPSAASADTLWIRNDSHAPITVESSPSGEQIAVAACSTVVLTMDQPGWRLSIDGRDAFSHQELVASGIDGSDRHVRIDVTSNDVIADVRTGDVPEPGIIEACAAG